MGGYRPNHDAIAAGILASIRPAHAPNMNFSAYTGAIKSPAELLKEENAARLLESKIRTEGKTTDLIKAKLQMLQEKQKFEMDTLNRQRKSMDELTSTYGDTLDPLSTPKTHDVETNKLVTELTIDEKNADDLTKRIKQYESQIKPLNSEQNNLLDDIRIIKDSVKDPDEQDKKILSYLRKRNQDGDNPLKFEYDENGKQKAVGPIVQFDENGKLKEAGFFSHLGSKLYNVAAEPLNAAAALGEYIFSDEEEAKKVAEDFTKNKWLDREIAGSTQLDKFKKRVDQLDAQKKANEKYRKLVSGQSIAEEVAKRSKKTTYQRTVTLHDINRPRADVIKDVRSEAASRMRKIQMSSLLPETKLIKLKIEEDKLIRFMQEYDALKAAEADRQKLNEASARKIKEKAEETAGKFIVDKQLEELKAVLAKDKEADKWKVKKRYGFDS